MFKELWNRIKCKFCCVSKCSINEGNTLNKEYNNIEG